MPDALLAPIVLFCYKRQRHLEATLESLAGGALAAQSTLYIYADGPRKDIRDRQRELAEVEAVRDFIHQPRWRESFGHLELFEAETNRGLAPMVIHGVSEVIRRHGRIIVVEDDVVVGPYFLEFMNEALELYRDEAGVGSVRAHAFDLPDVPELYFAQMNGDFAWGTWRRVWQNVSFDGALLLAELKRSRRIAAFDYDRCYPYTQMLRDQIAGRNSSWGVRFYASMFLNGQLTLYPGKSLASHMGYDTGTHFSGGVWSPLDATLFKGRVTVRRLPVMESASAREQMKQLWRQQGFASFRLPKRVLKSILPHRWLCLLQRHYKRRIVK